MANRRHSKLTALPPELLAAIDVLLVKERKTYAEITAYLQGMGHEVSAAGVGRYAQGRLAELERVKLVSDQMKALRDSIGDDAMALQEGAVQLTLAKAAEYLQLLQPESMLGEEANKIFRAIAELQKSSVARERLKLEIKKKVAEAADEVVRTAKAGGLSDEAAAAIRQKILGVAA